MRLFLTIAGTLLVTAMVLFGLHLKGLTHHYAPFESPFFEPSSGGEKSLTILDTDFATLTRIAAAEPQIIFWNTLHRVGDHFVIQDLKGQSRPAHDFFSEFKDQRFVLNVPDNVEGIHVQVANFLRQEKVFNRVIVQSDYDVILISIKELEPLWLYGTGRGELTRFLMMHSLYLETLVGVSGDVFFSPFRLNKKASIDARVVAEIHRRHKKIVVGPVHTEEEYHYLRELRVDGVIFEDEALALRHVAGHEIVAAHGNSH
jgi:hypothetical protein